MGLQGTKHPGELSVCVCVCVREREREKNTFNTGMFESLKQDPLLCNLPLGSVRPLPSVFIFNIPWKMRMMKIEAFFWDLFIKEGQRETKGKPGIQ